MIISHIKPSEKPANQWPIQSNANHSNGVAVLASKFANEFGFKSVGRIEGLLHDKGKEQIGFQRYIKGITGYDPSITYQHTPHAFVGALLAKKLYPQLYPLVSYPIMGHHTGLYDYSVFNDKMQKPIPNDVTIDIPNAPNDITRNPIDKLDVKQAIDVIIHTEKQDLHHIIRMLFSCLVDADFLDTEAFMNQDHARLRGSKSQLQELQPLLARKMIQLNNTKRTAVNLIRTQIQQQCMNCSDEHPGFFSLTVPTGGGKTISSLVWAIHHAIKYGKKRIIVAIPYTSIITQTAQTLREIFGEENVLEHHSNTAQI